jgi:hypothetical protein
MLTVAWLLLSVVAQAADARRTDLEVRAAGGEVTIHARNLPLSQILDRLARATGMDLTYDGARPGIPVTLNVENVSQTEAVLRLMEGLGISYVLRTDASGQRVDLLVVSGEGAGTGPLMASSQPPPETYDEPVAEYAHIPLDPAALEAAGGQTRPDLNNPYLGLPPALFPQAAPGYQPPAAEEAPPPDVPAPPVFPQGVSYPRR